MSNSFRIISKILILGFFVSSLIAFNTSSAKIVMDQEIEEKILGRFESENGGWSLLGYNFIDFEIRFGDTSLFMRNLHEPGVYFQSYKNDDNFQDVISFLTDGINNKIWFYNWNNGEIDGWGGGLDVFEEKLFDYLDAAGSIITDITVEINEFEIFDENDGVGHYFTYAVEFLGTKIITIISPISNQSFQTNVIEIKYIIYIENFTLRYLINSSDVRMIDQSIEIHNGESIIFDSSGYYQLVFFVFEINTLLLQVIVPIDILSIDPDNLVTSELNLSFYPVFYLITIFFISKRRFKHLIR